MRRDVLLAVVLLALRVGPALAQETTATVTGTVSDQTGAVLPGVSVVARNTATGTTRGATTTGTGRYSLPFLGVGEYEISYSLAGFQPHLARGVAVHVNDRLTINARLNVRGEETRVEISTASALVQATPAVQWLMRPQQVQSLPLNNRNFVQLATLVPGVVSSLPDEVGIGLTSSVSISIAGARRNAVNWLVDGASNVDVGSNITLLSTPTLESIEEFKILTSSYAAEWPRSGGGVVNVLTRAGSNAFRASVYEFLRNDALNANGFFRRQSADPAVASRPPQLDYHDFGYTLGGPLRRDRAFFFWSQEWRVIDRAPTDLVANVPDPAWLTDPANPDYVAPGERDPNALRLLSAFPAPNTGSTQYRSSAVNEQRTRQEVLRLDWTPAARWRLMARYTHDLSRTAEPGGLFFNTPLPDLAATRTRVPGQVFVAQLTTTLGAHTLNELSLQYATNAIESEFAANARRTREAFGIEIPELQPENRAGLIPQVSITGLSTIGANQPFDNSFKNATLTDSLSLQRGNHTWKAGILVSLERKDELSTAATQGSFTFAAGGGRTAFQNFLTGNADGRCGASCGYAEPATEVAARLRWQRYEAFVQDSWRLRPGLIVDYGLRFSVYPGVVDERDQLDNFVPERFDPAAAPAWSSPDATTLVVGSGDFTNGIVVAGRSSPYGRRIQRTEADRLQPRIGFAWDTHNDGRSVVRGGFGVYYDEPLVGVFLQNAFANPPFAGSPVVVNARLSDPGAGGGVTTVPPSALFATGSDFSLPRTLQYNLGLQRRVLHRAVLDVGYLGSRGDHLIQPVDVNQPLPKDVVAANGVVNLARPYQGYASITMRQTTARSRYDALAVSLRYESGRSGTLTLAYTLSRAKTSATNDRDTVDLPQDRSDLEAEYALARTDRTHVFSATGVLMLPFFDDKRGLAGALLRGWQLSGIATFWSGPPVSRVVTGNTNGGRRGTRLDAVSDPFEGVPASGPGYVYWFDPAAFAPPADGALGSTGRAGFRLPGVNQWDLTLAKRWALPRGLALQLRADFINAFNHTQLDPTAIQNVCVATSGSCAVAGSSFGQITATRSPREVQLGLRLSWN